MVEEGKMNVFTDVHLTVIQTVSFNDENREK